MPSVPPQPFYHLLTGPEGRARSDRFWSKVAIGQPEDCWDWQASRNTSGYGRFKIASHFTLAASRVAWAMSNRRDPGEMLVLHNCDRPCCCNPDHLRLGTTQDNSDDKIARGRVRSADQAGSNNGAAKIDETVLRTIIERMKGGWNNQQIARDLPVGHALVSRIRRGRSWVRQASALGWKPTPKWDHLIPKIRTRGQHE